MPESSSLGFTLDLDALSSQEDPSANPGVPLTQIVGIEEQMQLAMQLSLGVAGQQQPQASLPVASADSGDGSGTSDAAGGQEDEEEAAASSNRPFRGGKTSEEADSEDQNNLGSSGGWGGGGGAGGGGAGSSGAGSSGAGSGGAGRRCRRRKLGGWPCSP